MARAEAGVKRTRRSYLVPDELLDWIDEVVAERDVSANLVVQRALEHYRLVLPPSPPAPGSPADLAAATAAMLDGR